MFTRRNLLLMLITSLLFILLAVSSASAASIPASEVMSYEEYLRAYYGAKVCIEAYVQANEAWRDNKITLYMQDEDNHGFYIHNMTCTAEEAALLCVPGTKLRISGTLSGWDHEYEIIDAIFEILESEPYISEAQNMTALFSSSSLLDYLDQKVIFKGLIIAPSPNDTTFLYGKNGNGSHDANSDLYFVVERDGNEHTFRVVSSLTDNNSDVYRTVENLQIGEAIDCEGFLHWDDGGYTTLHITSIIKNNTAFYWSLSDEGILIVGGQGDMPTTVPWKNCKEDIVKVIIQPGLTSINYGTFSDCVNLTSITLPESISRVSSNSFTNCNKLNEFHVSSIESWLSLNIFEGNHPIFRKDVAMWHLFIGDIEASSVLLPDGLEYIKNKSFINCVSLTDVVIPDSVTSIESDAFYGCIGLAEIIIPDSVINIGSYAFAFCYDLVSVKLPNNLEVINDHLFEGCRSLNNIIIPDSVKSIGFCAFNGCRSLSEISIPDSVTSIESWAFSFCENLAKVKLSSKLSTIAERTFGDCDCLMGIMLPESVTRIDDYAFQGCVNLRSITIPQNVIYIGDGAFLWCDSLSKVCFDVVDDSSTVNISSSAFNNSCSDFSAYCYMYTDPASWCISHGITPIYLDQISVESIQSVTLPDDFSIACGDSLLLSYDIFPSDGSVVSWSSSDSDIVSVDNGYITAHSSGIATITGTVGNLSDSVVIESYVPVSSFELSENEMWVVAALDDVDLSVVCGW